MFLYTFFVVLSPSSSTIFGNIVSLTSVIPAVLTAIAAVILYIWPLKNNRKYASFFVYGLLVITAGAVVIDSGGVLSPLIALWMLITAFAALFGRVALIAISLVTIGYFAYLLTQTDLRLGDALPAMVFSGILPLIVGYIIWHRQADREAGKDKAFRELANELSQVSGKSDVVINAIADGVIALDNQGVIELINPAAQKIIGWVRQDALGLDYRSVLKLVNHKNEPVTETDDPVAQALATNKAVRNEKLTLITESEKKLLVSVVVSPIDVRGSGAIIVFRDITKEKLEERQQAEFISTASHEMRTPVASIEGYLGLALNPNIANIDAKAREYIIKAHESAQHLGRLFQDLLDVSKAEDNRLQNDPKVVNIVEFAADVVEGLRQKAEEKGLRLVYKPKPDTAPNTPQPFKRAFQRQSIGEKTLSPVFYANVDNDHLREIIANLVENAIKYTPAGDVVVDITGDDKKVIVSVQDSGIGIPAEDIPHLFQKFYRVDNTATREIGGTGLGLYLCRRLAEAMSGRIWVESAYKQGSTFHLEVPRIDHEEATRLIEDATSRMEKEAEDRPTINPLVTAATSPDQAPQAAAAPVQQPVMPQIQQPQQSYPQPVYVQQPVASPQPITPPNQPAYPQNQPIAAPIPTQIPVTTPPQTISPNTPLTAIEQNPGRYLQSSPQLYPPNQT